MMKRTLVPALVLAAAAATPAISMADGSGNIGFQTDYVFRGIFQAESSAYAGADYSTESGFYVGTWWADVGLGTETDIYFGWQGGSDDVKFKVGYTGYRYLDDFDGDYDELNLGLYAGIFSLDVAVGTYEPLGATSDTDYVFTSLTLAPEMGPYYKVGLWSGDYTDDILPFITKDGGDSGNYLEIGYTWSFEDQGIDFTAALLHSSDLPVAGLGNPADYFLTFGIKKTFAPK
jgi:uncharacterized protein (TIGR02001 family)